MLLVDAHADHSYSARPDDRMTGWLLLATALAIGIGGFAWLLRRWFG
jgi:hypothetical protein